MKWLHPRWFAFPGPSSVPRRQPVRGGSRYCPRLELLEERRLPSTVTNLNDSGPGSLRDAIATTPVGYTVDFQPGLTGTITLTTGSIVFVQAVTVVGPGSGVITVSGNGASQVFNVHPGVSVTITGLTLANGAKVAGGGGIYNAGTLHLTNVVFQGNTADRGGGLYNEYTGTAVVERSTFTGNSTTDGNSTGGGAITNVGTMTLTDSTLSGNQANVGPFLFSSPGGAIDNPGGSLTVSRCTFSNNRTVAGKFGSSGGAIEDTGPLVITDSTFSGNVAEANLGSSGGAIIVIAPGSLTLTNVTISGNTAGSGAGLTVSTNATANLRNTLIAGNFAMTAPDVSGAIATAFHDLIGNGDGSTGLVNGQNGNQVGTSANPIDPVLSPLRNNGGPTFTEALLPGSPAVAAGDPAFATGPTDQRGFPRLVNDAIDIGAYELQHFTPAQALFAVGGAPGRVEVHHNSDGSLFTAFAPFGSTYTGGVAVAVADIDGDGFLDLITAATVGNPNVKVYSGAALANGFNPNNPDASLLTNFFAYGLNFNVGANVAAGDIEHNGFPDLVTGATAGNPDVHIYRGKDIALGTFTPTASLVTSFFPYAQGFNIGVNVAVGDVSKDGYADLVTGPTAGNPDVRVYNGKDIAQGTFDPAGKSLLAQFFPYALNFNVGAFVAVGDTNGDGYGDVITGATAGNPDVRVYDGKAIATGTFDNSHPENSQLTQFFAFSLNAGIGVAVASADFETNGLFDILTGARSGVPQYRVVKGDATGVEPPALFEGIAQGVQGSLLVGA